MKKLINSEPENENFDLWNEAITEIDRIIVSANQTNGQKNEPRSTSAQIPYSVHHNESQ